MSKYLNKTSKEGVYTRILSEGKETTYHITYRIEGKFYKKKLGSNLEGWTVNKASKERAKRIGEGKAPISKIEQLKTFDDIAQDYFISITHKSDYKNTVGRYNNHIKPTLGDIEIRTITVSMIQTLKLKLSKIISNKTGKTLSSKSINDRIDLINTIYNYYNKINYTNPIQSPATHNLVERYTCDNTRLRFLSKDEYNQLLDAIKNRNANTIKKNVLQYRTDEMLLYVKLLATTGMRTYSALTLRAKDFDFTAGTIQVKNHKANRIYTSFIHPSIKEELQQICENLNPEYYIFGKKNEPYHRSTINKRLLPIMNKLFNQNVTDRKEKVVVHSLRHTCGSWLAQKGVSLYVICKLLDHKDVSMTQQYAKFLPESGKEFINNL